MRDGSMDNYNPDKQRTMSGNSTPHEGLKNMLDLAEVIRPNVKPLSLGGGCK